VSEPLLHPSRYALDRAAASGDLAPLAEHLAGCADCAAHVRTVQERRAMPERLASLAQAPARMGSRWWWAGGAVALAAALLVVLSRQSERPEALADLAVRRPRTEEVWTVLLEIEKIGGR